MRKTVISLLCAVLLCGCASGSAGTDNADTDSGSESAVKQAEESYETAGIHYGTVARKAEEIEYAFAEERWDDIAALFAANKSADEIRSEWFSDGEDTYSPAGAAPIFRDGNIGAVVFLTGSSGAVREAVIRMNKDLQIEEMRCFMRPEFSSPEESELWTEEWIYAGNEPRITGILTLPVPQEDEDDEKTGADEEEEEVLPPVAVLVGEEPDDAMNESGSNAEFRKELAHLLAENGVASVRFNTRCYEDPVLCEMFGYDLDVILSEDIASIFHSLETYPVDARTIVYVGHGAAGTMGYSYVNHHFEVTGGLVLINAPYTESGAELFTRASWLDAELAETAQELLEEEDPDLSKELGGFPLSYWQDWNNMGALLYTRYVAIPILIQQAEDDSIVTVADDFDNWKSQKGSNVTMKKYPDIGHDLREADGTFAELIAEDIADWLNGENINAKKTATSTTATGRRS